MNINTNYNQTSFGMKFLRTASFKEVVNYAQKTNQLNALDNALNRLDGLNTGDILLMHGKSSDGTVFSNFTLNKRTVRNTPAKTPEETSFNAILDLSDLGYKFRRLVGDNVTSNVTPEKIFEKYSV